MGGRRSVHEQQAWGRLSPGHTSAFLVFAMLCSAFFLGPPLYSLFFPVDWLIFVVQKLILI